MSDSTCPNCSATVPSGAAFCTSCGHRMETAAQPTGDDATRVDSPGLHDSTQVIPPTPPPTAPPAGAWQPSGESAPSSDWSAAPPASAPSGEQPWAQAQAPQAQAPQAQAPWGQQPGAAPTNAGWGQQPPQGGGPAWGAPAPATSGASGAVEPSPVGGIVAIAGGVLTVIGLFIAWFKLSAGEVSNTVSGWDLASSDKSPFESNDPYLLLALGIAGIAVGALLFLGKMRPIARIAAIVIAVAIIVVVLRDWMTASDIVKDMPGVKITQQVGFFIPIVGAVLLGVGAVLPAKK